MLEKENKQFNLLQLNVFETFQNFSKFQEITGQGKFVSILEYIDLILTGTSQKMKVFGIEVATARKVMYGFLTLKTEEIGKPAHQLLNQNLMIKDYFLKIFFRQNLQ